MDENDVINQTVNRENIWMAQTPQAFNYKLIFECHQHAIENQFIGTDDASLVEYAGKSVSVITGSRNNIKITNQEDLILARGLVTQLTKVP